MIDKNLFKEVRVVSDGEISMVSMVDKAWWKATKKWIVFILFWTSIYIIFYWAVIVAEKNRCNFLLNSNSDFTVYDYESCETLGIDLNRDGIAKPFYSKWEAKNLKVVE